MGDTADPTKTADLTSTQADPDVLSDEDGEDDDFPEKNAPVVLSVNNVYKDFKLPTEQATGLKQAFINWTKGIRGYKIQHVLKGISFDVHQGEFFGIVGRNGGGKSTLLKIISQIYYPNKGSVSVTGKLVPFIELGVGFNPELTGRENVYLNGSLLGFARAQVDAMYDDIVDFAELGDFMDQKLKNYSSGMQVRLAFSVAIKAQADVLVLDEVLAVGDAAFQHKCDEYFKSIKRDPTKTVILVTHDMGAVKKYCSRALMIEDGKIVAMGDPNKVADRYTLANKEAERQQGDDVAKALGQQYPAGLNERVPKLKVRAISDAVTDATKPFEFAVDYQIDDPGEYYLRLKMVGAGAPYNMVVSKDGEFSLPESGTGSATFSIDLSPFNNRPFLLIASIIEPDPTETEPDANGNRVMRDVATTWGSNALEFSISNKAKKGVAGMLTTDVTRFVRTDK